MKTLADHIRDAAWTHGKALRQPETARAVADAWERPPEPTGVVIADDRLPEGEYRLQKTYRILEDGVWRELKLRVARGVIRDVENREPREGRRE